MSKSDFLCCLLATDSPVRCNRSLLPGPPDLPSPWTCTERRQQRSSSVRAKAASYPIRPKLNLVRRAILLLSKLSIDHSTTEPVLVLYNDKISNRGVRQSLLHPVSSNLQFSVKCMCITHCSSDSSHPTTTEKSLSAGDLDYSHCNTHRMATVVFLHDPSAGFDRATCAAAGWRMPAQSATLIKPSTRILINRC